MHNIIKSLKAKSNMSDGSIHELLAHSVVLELPKKHTLTSSLLHDRNFYFIEKGITRSYCVIHGKEVTSWFSMEGDIVWVVGEQDDLKRLFVANEPGRLEKEEPDE